MHQHAAVVATLPSAKLSFPLDGGGGCGGDDVGEGECRAREGRSGSCDLDVDLYHRILHHPRPLGQRLEAVIELAQPCRERVTENGVVKEVHVVVKNVPFSIHVRLPQPPPLPLAKHDPQQCAAEERRRGKERTRLAETQQQEENELGATPVVDLRGLELEVRLRYDGESGRAVPFVQRPPLEIIASRVDDDGRSAVLTARVRALSSQHQNRLFVAHVRAFRQPAPEMSCANSPARTTSSLPSSGVSSPASASALATDQLILEALTEPIQVISKPRSSRKRVVRRKRTLGDMLLDCTQRIESAQQAHLTAIGTLAKRCRLVPLPVPRSDLGVPLAPDAATVGSGAGNNPPPWPAYLSATPPREGKAPLHSTVSPSGGDYLAEDPQLMMLLDLPSAEFLPCSLEQAPGEGLSFVAHPPCAASTSASALPSSVCSAACASSSSSSSSSCHTADRSDSIEDSATTFLRTYAALPASDRPVAIRRVLRKYGTDRLQVLASLLALLASPPPHKQAQGEASFQSCVCTSCSYEAELLNMDSFYKDLINLEFSFQ